VYAVGVALIALVIADSGQGYGERGDVREAVERIKRHAPSATVNEA